MPDASRGRPPPRISRCAAPQPLDPDSVASRSVPGQRGRCPLGQSFGVWRPLDASFGMCKATEDIRLSDTTATLQSTMTLSVAPGLANSDVKSVAPSRAAMDVLQPHASCSSSQAAAEVQAPSKSIATPPSLASHSATDGLASPATEAADPSTTAMDDLQQSASCSSPDTASAGEKRSRHSPEDVEDWVPGMGLDDDSGPQARRARLAATSRLYDRLVQQTAIIRAHVVKLRRQDHMEREISRRVAARHPLRAKLVESPALSFMGPLPRGHILRA